MRPGSSCWRGPGANVGAAMRQRRGVETIDLVPRARPQAHMRAAVAVAGHRGAQVDPEFGVALAEADRRRSHHELRVTERAERRLVKALRLGKRAHPDRDMVDHAIPPARGVAAAFAAVRPAPFDIKHGDAVPGAATAAPHHTNASGSCPKTTKPSRRGPDQLQVVEGRNEGRRRDLVGPDEERAPEAAKQP